MSTTQSPAETATIDEGVVTDQTSLGLDENVAGALAYALGIISGLIVFFLETENRRVKWHGAQSTVLFLGIGVTYFVISTVLFALAGIGGLFGLGFALVSLLVPLLFLGILALWLFMIVRTYQGKTVRIPIAATVADSIVN